MKILVVDDEQDIALLFQQRFRKEIKTEQVAFHFAFSGQAALDFLRKQGTADIVLILSDINMPGMSGFELLQRIKTEFAAFKVFLITAYGDQASYQTAMASGADGYLTKPIDFDNLKQEILTL